MPMREFPGARAAWCAFAFALAGAHVLLFNRDLTVDGLAYAAAVDAGGPLFHSNHLLFNAMLIAIKQALASVGWAPAHSIGWIQAAVAACGVITVLAIGRGLVARAGHARAMLLAALAAGSFALFNFSQEPEVYVPAMCCIALSWWLLEPSHRVPGRARLALLTLLAVLAVLLLQQHVFWYPTLLMLLHARLRNTPGACPRLLAVALAVPLLCLLAYLAAGWMQHRIDTPAEMWPWLLGYGYDPETGIATYRAAPPLAARVAGLGMGLVNLVLAYEVVLAPALMAAGALALAAVAFALLPAWARVARTRDRDTWAWAAFTAGNLAFAFWWESRNIEFLLPVGIGALMLAGQRADALSVRILLAATVLVWGVNAVAAYWPQRSTPERYASIARLHQSVVLGPGDVVITEELNTVQWLRYFHAVEPRHLSGAVGAAMHGNQALPVARSEIDAALARGARVFTLEPGEHGRLRAMAERLSILGRPGYRGDVAAEIDALHQGHRLLPVRAAPGAWQVLPAAADPGGEP